ncbi:WcaI family glycosyltransferase [Novosphingobium sp. TH158]|uniref:WcaI family glycosyltransferase n=1 Tax=Novosphingobium sp. TH158 TaxID=2067455 RepID=UPI000C79A7E3|nr:WcaI family glycosyltransferase [Novosphingobium sp. TH158]PLK27387.1 colanic acid biosynthesis glycosyltransferase WcaI [Novosphingobium sp. TH158]
MSGTSPQPILIVGLNYAPEPVGIGPFTRGMAEGLAQQGHAVRVIAGRPYYPMWRAYDGFGAGWATSVEGGVSVTRCPHYIPSQPSGIRRVVHLASFTLAAMAPALRSARLQPGVVICVAPSLLSVPVAWLAAKAARARLWIHVQDFEVEAAFATGLLKAGLAARLARWVENRLLRLADRVSSISPQMCARLVEKGIEPARVLEVRNWANAPQPDPTRGAAYRAQWGLGSRKVALYSGNIANKQGIEIVVEAARLLQARKDLAFVICGEGPNRARLEALAQGLDNIRFDNLQPAERMGELLALADVHLLPQIAGAADLVLPSKLANMLWSGRPVVATASAGTGLHAEVQGCGIATEPGDAAAFGRAIATLIDDPALADGLGAAGRERAAERCDRQAIVTRMADAIGDLVEGRRRA